jgi:hypothetical protein
MDKIANPQQLSDELRRLIAYAQGEFPSRDSLAEELRTLADRVAKMYKQKGPALRKRKKQYKKTKAKSKRQSGQWRKRNKAKIKRYEAKRKRSPSMHRMRRRASITFSVDIPFWDIQEDLPGEVQSFDPETYMVETDFDGTPKLYDLDTFLSATALLNEKSEQALFEALDEIHGVFPEEALEE